MPPGADTAELRWAMPDEPLSQVELRAVAHLTRVLGSTDDVTAVAQGLAEAIQAGRVNRDVYSYVYDTEAKELVLTGATESPAAEHVGALRVAYGDGVTGWVAATKQSYLVPDEPARDPRFLAYPGIGEERYGAIFSVPIVSPRGEPLGCITVWATTGHRFDSGEVAFVERMAALVAPVFGTARQRQTSSRLLLVGSGLTELASMVASATPTGPTMDYAVEFLTEAAGLDVAVAFVTDPSGVDRMHMKVSTESDRARPELDGQQLLLVEQGVRNGITDWRTASQLVNRALDGVAGAVTSAPMRVGPEEFGVIACYRLKPVRFTSEESAMVTAVANHAAVAIRLAVLSDELAARNRLNWFLRDLSSGRLGAEELRRRAAAVGLDTANRHVFVVGSVSTKSMPHPESGPVSVALGELLAERAVLPQGTLYASTPHQTVAVVPWHGDNESIDTLRVPLLEVCTRLRAAGRAVTFGVSQPVSAPAELAGALAEAREAMAIGSGLDNPNGVFTLDDVGHHLLLMRVSGVDSIRDRYATAIARIAEYDRVKGTELLETLSVFLHYRSQSAASRELYVHRNTLNQRLTRASTLSDVDVLEPSEWFPLQLALKVHQSRAGMPTGEPRRPQTYPEPRDGSG
ncbi:GAF domain-containing protein [Mycolicibacterium vanbaalenii]|uniref:GAF sensor protein n=1 Tax=Mycolicibacterium vanbaalenii (strain DSM 7251 / JCM 13017 / BCRC 16820 / KCTC 9966 / NRRL B-24157 / PYR-1) TaxID=350058 RepID=A1T5I3_MYCVP|nr:GAF domain-containing protein [Mycolicibacterium vanbaalenii]ABM12433.1 putative GAF sensor protein [Mycolicibacterium vanbaalenii PYR-1]